MDVEARTGYEASKLARERYAEYFHNFHGMSLAGMRFFSVYQGFGGAEEHKGEYANTVAQFTHKIASGERPELFGDGTQTRDFTHVDDIVRACEVSPPTTNSKASTTSARPRATPSTRWWR